MRVRHGWLVCLLALPACNTMADVKAARGRGLSRTFEAPFAEVWDVVPAAVPVAGLSYVGRDRDECCVFAERGMTAFSWGEKVVVFVDAIDETVTKVEVVSKRAVSTNITAANFESALLGEVARILERRLTAGNK